MHRVMSHGRTVNGGRRLPCNMEIFVRAGLEKGGPECLRLGMSHRLMRILRGEEKNMRKIAIAICIAIAVLLFAGCPADTGISTKVPSWLSGRAFECVSFIYNGQTTAMDGVIQFDDNEIYATIKDNGLGLAPAEDVKIFGYLDDHDIGYMINQYPTGDMYSIVIPEYEMTISMNLVMNLLTLQCGGDVSGVPVDFTALLAEK